MFSAGESDVHSPLEHRAIQSHIMLEHMTRMFDWRF
jgi:hypothetical protein